MPPGSRDRERDNYGREKRPNTRKASEIVDCRALLKASLLVPCLGHPCSASPWREGTLPKRIPAGTKLVAADQNGGARTLIRASGVQAKPVEHRHLSPHFLIGGQPSWKHSGPVQLDLATVGNTPPIQAHAAGEQIPIVAARSLLETDYLPGHPSRPQDQQSRGATGKSIAYGESTGRQPFVLNALKLAGLTRKDVKLVPLRAADFPRCGAHRPGRRRGAERAALLAAISPILPIAAPSALPEEQNDRLPKQPDLSLCEQEGARRSGEGGGDPRVRRRAGSSASRWSHANARSLGRRLLRQAPEPEAGGRAQDRRIRRSAYQFPLLGQPDRQAASADRRDPRGRRPAASGLDARKEFDLRFDEVISSTTTN